MERDSQDIPLNVLAETKKQRLLKIDIMNKDFFLNRMSAIGQKLNPSGVLEMKAQIYQMPYHCKKN